MREKRMKDWFGELEKRPGLRALAITGGVILICVFCFVVMPMAYILHYDELKNEKRRKFGNSRNWLWTEVKKKRRRK